MFLKNETLKKQKWSRKAKTQKFQGLQLIGSIMLI